MFHFLLSHPLSQITGDVTRTVIAKQPRLVLNDGRTKIILTGGNPQQLMQLHDQQLFYDRKGVLTQKFRLKAVPAVITRLLQRGFFPTCAWIINRLDNQAHSGGVRKSTSSCSPVF